MLPARRAQEWHLTVTLKRKLELGTERWTKGADGKAGRWRMQDGNLGCESLGRSSCLCNMQILGPPHHSKATVVDSLHS